MTEEILQEEIEASTGINPNIAETLAMQVLMEEAIEARREQSDEGLADLGHDFLLQFKDTNVTLAQMTRFKQTYL